MSIFSRGVVLLLLAVGTVAGTATSAEDASGRSMRQLMGANFQAVARILSDLVDARYDAIPQQATIMMQHADQLIAAPPTSLRTSADRAVFLAYANNLRQAASGLLAVSENLAKRDPLRILPGDLGLDYWRTAAARDLGDIVTSCAVCHGLFRRQSL
jgi:hypothetical protein